MPERESVRAFLAIPPDPGWAEASGAVVAPLRRELPEAAWTRPESWHVTLRFLGQVAPGPLEHFAAAIAETAAGSAEWRLIAAGPAVFPSVRRARVLGIALAEKTGALARLAAAAEAQARAIGLEPEERPFRPHVTLARLRRPWPPAAVERFRAAVADARLPGWDAREVVLYASRLGPGGAQHTPLARFELAASSEVAR